jgi:error-prone DNA polymerase
MSTARRLDGMYLSAGARKEQQRQRSFPSGRRQAIRYAELHAVSGFSFLDGAAEPEDLIERAAELELPAVALTDRNGVYGAPRFYKAAKAAGIRALVGAEVVIGERTPLRRRAREPVRVGPESGEQRVTVLVASQIGYRNLCRLLTASATDRIKGRARADLAMLAAHAEGLWCLSGGDEGPVLGALRREGPAAMSRVLDQLREIFPARLAIELQRHHHRDERHAEEVLVAAGRRRRLPLVATNGVRYANAADRALHDVFVCLRHGVELDRAGARLEATSERFLKSGAQMTRLFADLPEALHNTLDLASTLDFTLADLGYRFPDSPLPAGETPASYLRLLTWKAAPARFRPFSTAAQRQLEHELALIQKLDLAGYFLIVHELVEFCREHGILVQGRGSAANSAVCYALGITAVDPVKMGLLFERFLSEERGEWPDIDLDLPSGEPREQVIQHVYQRYGPHGAAMTATAVTWRDRSATREVAKVLGFDQAQIDRLAKRLGSWRYDLSRGDSKALPQELAAAGFDPDDHRIRVFVELWQRIQNRPRHMGQHSGGMVLARGRLDEIVPLEPATMAGRTVIQWDKDDCADLGLIKVDLLGLGMLRALAEAVPTIAESEGVQLDLAHLPHDCPKTWSMIQRADTVGVFQIESRAQMASLPRNRPERFYDLVIQVAIIRPGPIMGGMIHPFFERRLGRQQITYPHPSLEPILERTLGVPLFQEQILRIAMVAAGFSGGEAEELRRAMGFKRSVERMEAIERRLRAGMSERGIPQDAQEQIVRSITSFALYGFPESHAASFALIAWASAYLRANHPTAFLKALLNAWPMGFYHPATLIKDAERHGVEVRPVDVTRSGWNCRIEQRSCRLGLRYVKGLAERVGRRIEAEQALTAFADIQDLARRCELGPDDLDRLAWSGALAGFGLERRHASWQAHAIGRGAGGPLLEDLPLDAGSPLEGLDAVAETVADYETTGLTTGVHPMAHLRPRLQDLGILSAAEACRRMGGRVVIAGASIVRQRPGTAKGILFITLEDETGMIQAIVSRELLQQQRDVLVGATGLIIEGVVQQRDGAVSIRAAKVRRLDELLVASRGHDFR